MLTKWDQYSRLSLDVASTATGVGFSAAKNGTKLGFGIARGVASSVASLTGTALDHAVFGGSVGAGPMLGGAVSTAISALETLTLAPILIGESIASTTLVAAQSSLTVLQAVFPGSDEASFSLTSFVGLVRREWREDMQDPDAPEKRYGLSEIMKALVAWAALQGLTSEWQEKKWFKHLKEVPVSDPTSDGKTSHSEVERSSRIHVTTDVVFPSHSGQIITADIGDASSSSSPDLASVHRPISMLALKTRLRRFSKLVLAGYGGASLLFFGVPPIPVNPLTPNKSDADDEHAKLAIAVGSSEEEASGEWVVVGATEREEMETKPGGASYSWWNVLLGKHDRDILLHYAQSTNSSDTAQAASSSTPPPAISLMLGGNLSLMPRFWVLTDHARREVILVIRGTMSLNELAVDLTCDPADFKVTSPSLTKKDVDEQDTLDAFDEALDSIPGSFPIDLSTPPPSPTSKQPREATETSAGDEDDIYLVHGGMLKMAKAMGSRGKPVHGAVKHALVQNEGYDLVVCGHSLGAGVAALLALMWADPRTCLTHRRSGLPSNRRVEAFCYAPPCLVDLRLSKLAASSNLITSFVYSHDVVSRLSLGSVRDLRRAASWLSEAESERRGEGYGGVTGRALKAKTGFGKADDSQWFLAIRKTLEANMHMTDLYPPGRVLWAIRDGDLHPLHRLNASQKNKNTKAEKVRLFDVQDVEQVFGQIVFAKDMLSSHLPHQYDRVLHELL